MLKSTQLFGEKQRFGAQNNEEMLSCLSPEVNHLNN